MAFLGPWVVWGILGAPGEKKRQNQMFLQSHLRAKKTCTHFFFARKKEHLARGALARQAGCRWALGRLVGATNA